MYKTPEEMFTRKNPKVSHLKIFGCLVYIHIPKEKRIYIPGFHHMEISRDVTFDEEATLKRSRKCQHEEVYEEETPPRNEETTYLPEEEVPEEHDMEEP